MTNMSTKRKLINIFYFNILKSISTNYYYCLLAENWKIIPMKTISVRAYFDLQVSNTQYNLIFMNVVYPSYTAALNTCCCFIFITLNAFAYVYLKTILCTLIT